MKRFPAKVVSLVLALAMSLSLLTVSTVAEENGWWTEEIWDAETLISLGVRRLLSMIGVAEVRKSLEHGRLRNCSGSANRPENPL